ncbi:MAG: phosphate ABC transporter substrate-binding protein PstS [Cystobacterineae bacterium]|nr:phosphate ABC transporter substrate-binding protein PstS [Cystobacterineae bacterium]
MFERNKTMRTMQKVGCIAVAVLGVSMGCKPSDTTVDKTSDTSKILTQNEKTIEIQGAGASFPYPLYSKWMAEYQKVDPRIRVNYQSIGSGGGIRQITEKIIDFGGSDAPMTNEELAKASGKILHIPTTLGAVVVAYNLAEVSSLKLSSEVMAKIFLGEIQKWNDAAIAKLNDGVTLPNQPISVVYRTDGSGTTAVFTEYLSKTNASWKEKVGAGKSVKFPVGLGAKGNEGVSGQMKMTPGSIGYIELAYAKQSGLAYALVQNAQKQFVEPSLESISAAAENVVAQIPEDLRVSIVDAPGELSYPISSFTYVLVYEEQADATQGVELAKFLWWAVHDGQKFGAALHYAPLPIQVVTKIEAKLREMHSGKQVLLMTKS